MNVFVTGGSKNGKISIAQKFAKDELTFKNKHLQKGEKPHKLHYIVAPFQTTSTSKTKSNAGFSTIEATQGILKSFSGMNINDVFLIYNIDILLANEMYQNRRYANICYKGIINEFKVILNSYHNVTIVSDYIFGEGKEYPKETIEYIKSLGEIHKYLASECNEVWEVCYGNVIKHKEYFE